MRGATILFDDENVISLEIARILEAALAKLLKTGIMTINFILSSKGPLTLGDKSVIFR